jgi:predicted O-methyltransferase YrrM
MRIGETVRRALGATALIEGQRAQIAAADNIQKQLESLRTLIEGQAMQQASLIEGQSAQILAADNVQKQLATIIDRSPALEGQRAQIAAADNIQKQLRTLIEGQAMQQASLIERQGAQTLAADNIQKQLATIIDRSPAPTVDQVPVGTISVAALCSIPFPTVDTTIDNPIAAIVGAAEFKATTRFFSDNPALARALVSPTSQALLYCLLRNMKSENVVEIGTYRASTTEAMCRALHANGRGVVHTIDPFGSAIVPGIIAQWPPALSQHVAFHPVNSMAFFADFRSSTDLVFIDGNHDFEFALFDLYAAARVVRPRGFIVLDNISQPGPFFAARAFQDKHPEWIEMGYTLNRVSHTLTRYREGHPFDPCRTTGADSDFLILRAPTALVLRDTPVNVGLVDMPELRSVSITAGPESQGTLYLQCVLRTFTDPPIERTVERAITLNGDGGNVIFEFDPPMRPEKDDARFTVETWLTWTSATPLNLLAAPFVT